MLRATTGQAAGPGAEAPRAASRAGMAMAPGARLRFKDGVFELMLNGPTARAAGSIEGAAEFALVIEEPLIVLAYRIGAGGGWSWAPLEWQPAARPGRDGAAEAPGRDRRALLTVGLDGDGERPGPAARNLTLSLDFTRALDGAIRDRARLVFDPHAYQRALAALKRRCPTPDALLGRAVARTIGNP